MAWVANRAYNKWTRCIVTRRRDGPQKGRSSDADGSWASGYRYKNVVADERGMHYASVTFDGNRKNEYGIGHRAVMVS